MLNTLPHQTECLSAKITTIKPSNLKEALKTAQAKKWMEVCEKELAALSKLGTSTLVSCLPNRKIIDCKWVFQTKFNPDGTIDCYKAHLVTKGFSQVKYLDYRETFVPVAHWNLNSTCYYC
jgi:hypothetical protein